MHESCIVNGEPMSLRSLEKSYVVGPVVVVPVPVEVGAAVVGEFVPVVCAPMLNDPVVEYTSLMLLRSERLMSDKK